MITITIPIVPVAKGRPRFGGGRVFTPSKTLKYEREIAMIVRKQIRSSLNGALSVTLIFSMPKPKSCKREHPSVRPDIDNLQKSVLDSLNGIAWADDGQIVQLAGWKVYERQPFVQISIQEFPINKESK